MYQAGKEFSDKVLRPFSRGIVDSNKQTLEDADKTLQAIRKFSDTNKDLLDTVKQGMDAFSKTFREDRLPRPDLPGQELRPFLPPPPEPPRR